MHKIPFFIKCILMCFAIWAVAIAGRIISRQKGERIAAELISKNRGIPVQAVDAETINYLRGDYLASFRWPPFRPLYWTVNILTGETVAWQSKRQMNLVISKVR